MNTDTIIYLDLVVGRYAVIQQWGQSASGQSWILHRDAQFFDSSGELIVYQTLLCSLTATVAQWAFVVRDANVFGGVTCLWNIVAWISFIQMACMQLWDEVMFENKIADYCLPSLDGNERFVHVSTLVSEKSDFFGILFVVDHGLFEWLLRLASFVGCWWSVKANRPPLCKEADNQIIKP